MLSRRNPGRLISHNGPVTSTSLSRPSGGPVVNRPSTAAVGTIVWLGSEVMFFAGLFAIYFTLREHLSRALGLPDRRSSTCPFAAVQHDHPGAVDASPASSACSPPSACRARAPAGCSRSASGASSSGSSSPTPWAPSSSALQIVRVREPDLRARDAQLERLRLRLLPDDRLPRRTRHRRSASASCFIIGRAYAVKNFGHREATSAIVVSYYWHFVDVVWIGLFLVIYILK